MGVLFLLTLQRHNMRRTCFWKVSKYFPMGQQAEWNRWPLPKRNLPHIPRSHKCLFSGRMFVLQYFIFNMVFTILKSYFWNQYIPIPRLDSVSVLNWRMTETMIWLSFYFQISFPFSISFLVLVSFSFPSTNCMLTFFAFPSFILFPLRLSRHKPSFSKNRWLGRGRVPLELGSWCYIFQPNYFCGSWSSMRLLTLKFMFIILERFLLFYQKVIYWPHDDVMAYFIAN